MLKTANMSGLRLAPWAVLAASVTIGLIAVVLMTREIAAQSDQLILKIAKEHDVAIAGAKQQDRWGSTVSVGDINSDGQDDLLVGAREARTGKSFQGRGGVVSWHNRQYDNRVGTSAIRSKGLTSGKNRLRGTHGRC